MNRRTFIKSVVGVVCGAVALPAILSDKPKEKGILTVAKLEEIKRKYLSEPLLYGPNIKNGQETGETWVYYPSDRRWGLVKFTHEDARYKYYVEV
jgi:hypothetical protein